MPDVSYVPGSLTALVGDGCLALVDAPPDSPAVARVWRQLVQRAGVDVILADLLGTGFVPC
jgi:hypothetical protein